MALNLIIALVSFSNSFLAILIWQACTSIENVFSRNLGLWEGQTPSVGWFGELVEAEALWSLSRQSLLLVSKKVKTRTSDRSDLASSISSLIIKASWASVGCFTGQSSENWPGFHRIQMKKGQLRSVSGLLYLIKCCSVATVRLYWPATIFCAITLRKGFLK